METITVGSHLHLKRFLRNVEPRETRNLFVSKSHHNKRLTQRLLRRAPFLFNLLPSSRHNLSNSIPIQTLPFTDKTFQRASLLSVYRLVQILNQTKKPISIKSASRFCRQQACKQIGGTLERKTSIECSSVSNVNEVSDRIINNYKVSSPLFEFFFPGFRYFSTVYSNCFPRILSNSLSLEEQTELKRCKQ